MNLKNAHVQLLDFFNSCHEWLLIHHSGKSFALRKDEIETVSDRGRVLISFLDDKGYQTWRITAFDHTHREMILDLSRNFGTENLRVRFIPRVSAEELGEAVALALLEKANLIAQAFISGFPRAKLLRVSLNRQQGRFAHIIFQKERTQTAVLADLSDAATPEILLSNAIIWLNKLQRRKKDPVGEVSILTGKRLAGKLLKLHALLSAAWKPKIRIFTAAGGPAEGIRTESEPEFMPLESLNIKDLWRGKPAKLGVAESPVLSATALAITEFDRAKIDHIYTKHGETLRFFGLPFARVRKILDREECWFGIEREKWRLSQKTQDDFEKLMEDLENYRRFDSPYQRHEFYRQAPEAWLDSILKKNIKLLDANLILSPIYNQFRSSRDRIDLLALRRDGRLIIIELKVAPDREMIFQAADYWRKIELQRRKGVLDKAKLFGDKQIADRPALVYLVAPTLSFHRDFRLLAGTISPELEIYRFDLAENWRGKVKVLRREKLC